MSSLRHRGGGGEMDGVPSGKERRGEGSRLAAARDAVRASTSQHSDAGEPHAGAAAIATEASTPDSKAKLEQQASALYDRLEARAPSKDLGPVITSGRSGRRFEAPAPRLLDRLQTWVPLFCFLITAFTRFYRLDKPPGVVFDEHHFGRFTNQYLAGTYFFDIHPPLGKLVFYLVAKCVGYEHSVCHYANIDDEYSAECKFIWLRATSALFGSLTSPIVYQSVRNFGGSTRAGILSALLFTLDGLNIGESRLILIDAQLIFWCAASLLVAQFWWARWNVHVDGWSEVEKALQVLQRAPHPATASANAIASAKASQEQRDEAVASIERRWGVDPRRMTSLVRIAWAFVIGVVCANAISVKFTGLGTPGLVAIESFMALLVVKRAYPFPDLILIAAVAVSLFSSYYYIHFWLLPGTGDGDNFMLPEFRKTLIGNPDYDPNFVGPSFIDNLIYLNIDMVKASDGITQRHNWDSVWHEWMLNLRGILYYSVDRGHSYTESIYLLGNPLVIWFSLGAVGVGALLLVFYLRYRNEPELKLTTKYGQFFSALIFCMAGYWVNILPYLAVSRSCFIYHYMPALLYAEMMAGLILDQLLPKRWMVFSYKVVLLVMGAGFLYFCPWIYGFPLTNDAHARRRWLPRWD